MLFVIDVGNSHTVTGLYDGDQLVGKWRLQSDRKQTADELAIRYHTLFSLEQIDISTITGVVLASVVPTLETAWTACCRNHLFSHLPLPLLVINRQTVSDMIAISLPNPDEVGADRLVNAIAAYARYATNLVVVDFGTAITFDCVSARSEYLGGAIVPGIAISLEALSTRTAKLPHIDVSEGPDHVIGRSTVEAMKSGILHGYGAMLDGMIERISREMLTRDDGPLKVIGTGGMASIVAPYSSCLQTVEPMLTLEGLKYIHDTMGRK